ncbi:MAG: hypothetical protein J1E98_10545 [Lachnospiraceae bacterium]|nr:hypothetical protein [Lachnospiraceae bacterium]
MNSDERMEEVLNKSGIQQIRKMPKFLTSTFVLGVVNGWEITVADMIQAIINAIRIIKANFDVNQEKYAETIKFLKACKAFYENKHPNQVQKKALHYVVDVFHEIEDMRAVSDEQKKENEKISLALDLLIDINVKEYCC